MLNPKVRGIVEDIFNGNAKNLRESLSDVISEKAVSALEIKKVDVAKNFFAQDIREEKEDKEDKKDDDKDDDDEDDDDDKDDKKKKSDKDDDDDDDDDDGDDDDKDDEKDEKKGGFPFKKK